MKRIKPLFPMLAFCASCIAAQPYNSVSMPNCTSDSLELVKLYQKFNGADWTKKNNWLVPGAPIDSWYGVEVDLDGCVIAISLSTNNLSGTLYDIQFDRLLTLDLSNNGISGQLPDFSNLPQLSILNLNFNSLKGEVPDFTSLPNLTELKLYENRLTGEVPDFSNLPQLSTLWLGKNSLSGEIPDFTTLPTLKTILLNANKLIGNIPDFSNLAALQQLDLGANQLSGAIPDFSNLTLLEQLYLNSNNLSGSVPDFSNLPILKKLVLWGNKLSGTIPDFQNMPDLIDLYFTGNRFTGSIPDFSNLPKLRGLHLDFNRLSGSLPNFSNLPQLIYLKLDRNQLSGPIPDFTNLPQLNWLYLNHNLLSGDIPDFSLLTVFSIYYNNYVFSDILPSGNLGSPGFLYFPQNLIFEDTLISGVKGVPFTIDLGIDSLLNNNIYHWSKDGVPWAAPIGNNINSNKLTFPNPEAADAGRYTVEVFNPQVPGLILKSNTIRIKVCYERLDSLELVNLFNTTGGDNWTNHANWNTVGIPINSWFGITVRPDGCVQKLDLSNNNLVGTLPALNLNTLDTLILENNQLSNAIPEFKIPFVQEINLSKNQLTGAFPAVVNNWLELRSLNLGYNAINDNIPPDLGDLCELEALLLNNNLIVGELPEQLTLLFNLEIGRVDFSNNNIDSLKDRLIWFCPFGYTILDENPSYDRFFGICNQQCTGAEWENLSSFPWITDTLETFTCDSIGCSLFLVTAGYTEVRGVRVVFTRSRCYTSITPPVFSEEVRFYDCGGHLLETVFVDENEFNTTFGAIMQAEYDSLTYDIRWNCGQFAELTTPAVEPGWEVETDGPFHMLHCSPNPADKLVICTETVEQIHDGAIQLVDLLGRRIEAGIVIEGSQAQLDVSLLPRGIYLVSMQGEKARFVAKLLVK